MQNINGNLKVFGDDISERRYSDDFVEYRHKWHTNPKEFIVDNFPLFLDIEATSICNLKCPNCIQTTANFKKGFMPFELYEKIINEASENGCYGCKYHTIGRGEPLLNKQLPKMVAYAKKKGLIDVILNTNATLLTEDMSWHLLDAGLDRIIFSVDGASESYNKYRYGTEYWNVVLNICNFHRIANNYNYKTKVRIQTINYPEINSTHFLRFWKKHSDDISFLSYKEMKSRDFEIDGNWICPQPWQRMSILFDGSVLPCNHDDREYGKIGNVYEMSIRKAWHSSAMNFIRENQKNKNAKVLSCCHGCFLRTSELKKNESQKIN